MNRDAPSSFCARPKLLPTMQSPCRLASRNLRIFPAARKSLSMLNLVLSDLARPPYMWRSMFSRPRPACFQLFAARHCSLATEYQYSYRTSGNRPPKMRADLVLDAELSSSLSLRAEGGRSEHLRPVSVLDHRSPQSARANLRTFAVLPFIVPPSSLA